jgi:single-strand DNA-binding protein
MNGNTITIVGNLTKDPILKYLPTGKAVTNLSVACNHGWRDKETQAWVEGETSFFKVECWEPMAENIAESLRKGDPVIVVGRMSCRKYEQEGQTRESWEIRAETVGPDMRKRAASLRRVLRHSQTSEGQETPDVAEATEPDEKQDGERLQPAADFAVAS